MTYLKRVFFATVLFSNFAVFAQSSSQGSGRVDLDDVSIQGELLSDDRIRLLARQRNILSDELKVRTDFRAEIAESLPPYFSPEPKMH